MSSSGEITKKKDDDPLQFVAAGEPQGNSTTSQADPPKRLEMSASFSAEMYIGPIPPPSIMEGWEKVLPGSADRILKMAEKQSAHRISIEAKVIDATTGEPMLVSTLASPSQLR
jgi:uncharacterized membrane protein